MIENALEDAWQPIRLTRREAVQIERLLDFALASGLDKYAPARLRRALEHYLSSD